MLGSRARPRRTGLTIECEDTGTSIGAYVQVWKGTFGSCLNRRERDGQSSRACTKTLSRVIVSHEDLRAEQGKILIPWKGTAGGPGRESCARGLGFVLLASLLFDLFRPAALEHSCVSSQGSFVQLLGRRALDLQEDWSLFERSLWGKGKEVERPERAFQIESRLRESGILRLRGGALIKKRSREKQEEKKEEKKKSRKKKKKAFW